jgi:hypothetical protein
VGTCVARMLPTEPAKWTDDTTTEIPFCSSLAPSNGSSIALALSQSRSLLADPPIVWSEEENVQSLEGSWTILTPRDVTSGGSSDQFKISREQEWHVKNANRNKIYEFEDSLIIIRRVRGNIVANL